MAPPVWPFTLVFGAWTLGLVGVSLLLVWLTVRYRERLLHRAGVRELAASILLLTLGGVVEGTFWSGLTASPWALVTSRALFAASAGLLVAASWNFGVPFLDPTRRDREVETWLQEGADDE